jgi:hypothetical protein
LRIRSFRAEAENLAGEFAGEGATPEILELARRIAEAQIDLQRGRLSCRPLPQTRSARRATRKSMD